MEIRNNLSLNQEAIYTLCILVIWTISEQCSLVEEINNFLSWPNSMKTHFTRKIVVSVLEIPSKLYRPNQNMTLSNSFFTGLGLYTPVNFAHWCLFVVYLCCSSQLCAAWRFAPLLLAYALFRIRNPYIVAVSSVASCSLKWLTCLFICVC